MYTNTDELCAFSHGRPWYACITLDLSEWWPAMSPSTSRRSLNSFGYRCLTVQVWPPLAKMWWASAFSHGRPWSAGSRRSVLRSTRIQEKRFEVILDFYGFGSVWPAPIWRGLIITNNRHMNTPEGKKGFCILRMFSWNALGSFPSSQAQSAYFLDLAIAMPDLIIVFAMPALSANDKWTSLKMFHR